MESSIHASPAVISGDATSIYATFISTHALTATVSLVSGLVVITSRNHLLDRRLFSVYLWTLVGMTVFLAGAMLFRWPVYTDTERIAFSGLLVLASYMVHRAFSARAIVADRQNDWKHEYIHHIGFTLIALLEGFIIVALINLEYAGWSIAIAAVLGVVVGRRTIAVWAARQHTDAVRA